MLSLKYQFQCKQKCYLLSFLNIDSLRYRKFHNCLDHTVGVEYKFCRNDLASFLLLHIGMMYAIGSFFSLLLPATPWLPRDTWLILGCPY